ncbi:outer membrane lipoprotein chaperone LolA [Thalassotalea sp. G2M2-11]|uniref:outer membrane lipoprotein chaperone LolA n=1 Tax=Thalassotalea sp. G2M2-11 TaxID=2787627 RepID=UPI0019D0A854|nr:outer membrane lipoprotein chaperone LolA [Thalassotalea sp. G2M2-11]
MRSLITSSFIFSLALQSFVSFADTSTTATVVESSAEQVTDAKAQLMTQLAKTSFFSADFSQQVFDEQGSKLQQSQGKLIVKKPNLVYWQTTQPDPSLIVSDGDSLWFYDPFVEQVSVYTVDASIANTPILLLTSTDELLWQQYAITQEQSNKYVIKSRDLNSRVAQLTLTFKQGSAILSQLEILDSTGQTSIVSLENLDSKTAIDEELFHFTIPEGTYLDDQR